MYLKKQK
jgi:hypothetical protein